MRGREASITRRVTFAVLLLQFVAAAGLLTAVIIHEKNVQYEAFEANLRAGANALLGAVQEDVNEEVRLDSRGLSFPRQTIYRVTDERGRVIGEQGQTPALQLQPNDFQQRRIGKRSYRFFSLAGQRDLDPARNGGVHHEVTILFGQPDSRVWHEVVEAVRFVAVSTIVFLGLTALLLIWLLRRLLSPVHELALAAGEITSTQWTFAAPESAKHYIELRPLTNAIEQSVNRLEKAFEQQKRFTNDAAHELKTDLAIVKSSLQLIALKRRTVEEHEHGLAVGLSDLTRLERTVQRMLTLARLEQFAETGVNTCRFEEALQEAVRQSEPVAKLKTVALRVDSSQGTTVPLDRDDALLLCSNILVNALQHSFNDGTVDVSTFRAADRLRLTVRDHGEGIQQTEAVLLFAPFYRSDVSRSRKSGGSGLGLSICKALCERVGGTIHIANHPEGGALVTVELPVLQAAT